jgi:hypothetical protein
MDPGQVLQLPCPTGQMQPPKVEKSRSRMATSSEVIAASSVMFCFAK